jgi:hypothetical protein
MQPERFQIPDSDKIEWGKLVKQWIKGEVERPRTIDDLVAQCVDKGITPIVPSYIKGLVFVQNDKHVLTIRLPPKEIVDAGEQDFRENPNANYPLPRFYNDFFRDPPPRGEEKLNLQAARIGEYVVNSCL